jgi:hypothetical protein
MVPVRTKAPAAITSNPVGIGTPSGPSNNALKLEHPEEVDTGQPLEQSLDPVGAAKASLAVGMHNLHLFKALPNRPGLV